MWWRERAKPSFSIRESQQIKPETENSRSHDTTMPLRDMEIDNTTLKLQAVTVVASEEKKTTGQEVQNAGLSEKKILHILKTMSAFKLYDV